MISNELMWMLFESFLLGSCLYLLLRLRPWLGNTPLVVTVGSLQFIQVVLALSFYVEVYPGLTISPGSAIFFTGTILSVLLVYIVDDAVGARRLIYSLLIANVLLSLITYSVSTHMASESATFLLEIPIELFTQHPRVMLTGSITLFLDTVLIIIVYEYFRSIKILFFRITLALIVVLIFDSLVFVTGSFYMNENYLNILISNVSGKMLMVLPATLAISILDRVTSKNVEKESLNISDFFNLLTYRHKYELAKQDSMIDPLTRLFNRRALERASINWVDIGTYAILMIDADDFKKINDELGHTAGDLVIRNISNTITNQLRGSDLAYRYGGEEFLVFLPYTNVDEAIKVASRISDDLKLSYTQNPLPNNAMVTLSIGIAVAPNDGLIFEDVVESADQRLFKAKRNGKNQIVHN